MHMSDALITPVVGGTMLATSFGVLTYSIKKIDKKIIEKRVPYMAVVGAFLFAAQMINFSIPGTGSSGHIGGGMLLAILLGPYAGFLTMASVLLIQALFFADGGLLAFGCNLINLGFFTCYIAYPFIYKLIISKGYSKKNMYKAVIIASIIGLQLGSLGVVLETFISGKTELPITTFLLFMQPIHLAIGIVEGLITAAIVGYLYDQRADVHYDLIYKDDENKEPKKDFGTILKRIVIATLVVGVCLSVWASSNPDGLEWAIEHVSVYGGIENNSNAIQNIENFQSEFAIMPDYDFKSELPNILPSFLGTSLSGLTGSIITLMCVALIGYIIRVTNRYKSSAKNG